MFWAIVISVVLGFATVIQSGINRHVSKDWSLNEVAFFNNGIVLIISLTAFLSAKYLTNITPNIFKLKGTMPEFQWYFIIPAICGWFIVMYFPFAISKIGAAKVFIIVVAAQMTGSLVWDYYMEDIGLTTLRISSALLAIAAVVVANFE
jgi:uncharacterized membrane protein YdcZ (DUF606 family)